MNPGDLVGHQAPDRAPRIAVITEVLRGKFRVRTATDGGGNAKPIPARELTLLLGGAELEAQDLQTALNASPLPLPLLAMAWQEASSQEAGSDGLSLRSFALLLRSEPTATDLASAWLRLVDQQDLFRLRRELIEPRSLKELQPIRRERRQRQLRQQQRQGMLERLQQRLPLAAASDPDSNELRDRLLQLAAADDPKAVTIADDISAALKRAGYDGSPSSLQRLLVDLDLLQPGQPLSLLGSAWQQRLPEECQQQLEQLLAAADEPQPGDEQRRDLTALPCFSIDSSDTREVDDAIGLERRDGDRWIWVHIADPHRLIRPDSPLDLEARRRGSTLYLSSGMQPMLPLELGAGPLSLLAGRRQAAISMGIRLDAEGAVAAMESCRSWIRVSYRLSYDDADELIELAPPEDPDLADLDALLQQRRQWRAARGALLMDQAEGRLFRRGDGHDLALEISEPSPSRLMVAEAMLLAGASMASWCQQENLAMPFRSQAGADPERLAQAERFEEGPVRWAHQRSCLSRSRISCSADPHQSLGLEAYLQWTSPIRRYSDLLAHRQWLRHCGLLGEESETALESTQLTPLLERTDQLAREGNLIARADQRQALLQWLESGATPLQDLDGLLLRWLREDDGLALVRIDAWAMDLPARVDGTAEPGSNLLLQVTQVNAAADQLRINATPC